MNSKFRDSVVIGISVLSLAIVLHQQLPWQRELRGLRDEVRTLHGRLDEQRGLVRQAVAARMSTWREGREEQDWRVQLVGASPLAPAGGASLVPAPRKQKLRSPKLQAYPPQEDDQDPLRVLQTIDKGGVLLRKGKFQVVPSVTYSHVSSNRVGLSGFSIFDVIFIGEILSEEISRDIIVPSVTLRYGLMENVEVEAKFPWQYRRDQTFSGPLESRRESTTTESGVGDIEGGLYYQLVREHGLWPHLIANMQVKAPTGEAPFLGQGSWGIKTGLTAVKSSDPVVLYSNLGYYMNFPGEILGRSVDPGDSLEVGVGMAYALNYNLSVNAGLEQLFVGRSIVEGSTVPGRNLVVSNLKAGLTWALTRNLSLDCSMAAGLTADSPDMSVSFSMPYSF